MSGIAGIYNADGAPADRAFLQQMLDAMAHRGPDGHAVWTQGQVGLGHLMLRTTPESLIEKQPLEDGDAQLCIAMDGRIDNRDELYAALLAHDCLPRSNTDSELVLRAYACWGENCPEHIAGDFAFAIWDRRNRTLFCARDPVGFRPLFYIFNGRSCLFSSELRPLLDAPGFEPRINLGMLGEYLCDSVHTRDETVYRDIQRLPPGHRLSVQAAKLRVTRYYRIDPHRCIRYRSDDEYAEHFFDIFREAVRCRLRSPEPVALFLSGGVDSSSVLGMVAHLEQQGVVPPGKLTAYSLAYTHPAADERDYVRANVALWGGALREVDSADVYPESLAQQVERHRDLPYFPGTTELRFLLRPARAQGSKVCLWGFGGDEWLTGDPSHCVDSLRRMRLAKFLVEVWHGLQVNRRLDAGHNTLRELLAWCISPLVPLHLKSYLQRRLNWHVPRWIRPEFARAADLQERLMARPDACGYTTHAQLAIHGALESGYQSLSNEFINRFESSEQFEGRCPFNDRRLIEFALALPEEQRWRDDQTKFVLRQAMAGKIPESIRQRRTKADFSFEMARIFALEQAEQVFDDLRLAQMGFVDASAVKAMYRSSLRGDIRPLGMLWAILASERWLANVSIMDNAQTTALQEVA